MKTLHRPGQKYYTLNLQRAVLKTRTISCDLHWGNQTYKRIRGDCTKLLYNIIASQCPSHMERGDGGCQLTGIVEARHEGAGGKNEGEFRIHAAKWGRPDHLQKQITVTFHTRAALAAIHCDPVVSPNSYSTVCNMRIKAVVTCNATTPLTYHDVRRSFTEYALSRDSRCSHKQNPTVRYIIISSLHNDYSTSPC